MSMTGHDSILIVMTGSHITGLIVYFDQQSCCGQLEVGTESVGQFSTTHCSSQLCYEAKRLLIQRTPEIRQTPSIKNISVNSG